MLLSEAADPECPPPCRNGPGCWFTQPSQNAGERETKPKRRAIRSPLLPDREVCNRPTAGALSALRTQGREPPHPVHMLIGFAPKGGGVPAGAQGSRTKPLGEKRVIRSLQPGPVIRE
jgi:hypothetical protein